MANYIQKPRGTEDITPSQSYRWSFLEDILKETAQSFGYKEIRTPTFEHTELFLRGVGDTTDVVQKEMYTFTDKGNRSLTLKPEGTAGAIRAALENGLLGDALPLKLNYITPCFRYDKPQAGRYREFHQFGVEAVGTISPSCDAEIISLGSVILNRLGLLDISLQLNSIGCPTCRAKYHEVLKEYFSSYKDRLCGTCLTRLDKNPMRIIDCKVPSCKEIVKGTPSILDYICEECSTHFNEVQLRLEALSIPFTVDSSIVRGLDYYTKTVFEFVDPKSGLTVGGGGRYDGLVEELGGSSLPGIGFGMGIERILLAMEKNSIDIPQPNSCDVYLGSIGNDANIKALELTTTLRTSGIFAECDIVGRSVKAQMKYANKINAKFSLVLGDNEIATNSVSVKAMATGESTTVSVSELCDYIKTALINLELSKIEIDI